MRVLFAIALSAFLCWFANPLFADEPAPPASAELEVSVENLVIFYQSLATQRVGPAASEEFKKNPVRANLPAGTLVTVTRGSVPHMPFSLSAAFARNHDPAALNAPRKGWNYVKMEIPHEFLEMMGGDEAAQNPEMAEMTKAQSIWIDDDGAEIVLADGKALIALIDAKAADPSTSAEELEKLLAPYFNYLEKQP